MHNKISLIGNVGGDPEIRTVGDSKVASISLGVTERGYTTREGKKVDGKTTWFRVGFWQGLAEIVEKYVSKGDRLFVEGKMQSREYEKDGVKHTAWEVRATEIELISSKNNNGGKSQKQNDTQESQANQQDDDEIPF